MTELVVSFEAFLESAPQIILQLYIIFNTGIVSTTQIVSIILSLAILTKTAIFFGMWRPNIAWKVKLPYLFIHAPFYIFSAYFRLGSLALSTIFFGFWTVIPVTLFLFLLFWVACYKSFDWDDMALTLPSNLFAVSH